MNLSEETKFNAGAIEYSDCGKYIAFGCRNVLKILDVENYETVLKFSCDHDIKTVNWSSDSHHILCTLKKTSKVQAFSLSDPGWICSLDEGDSHLEAAVWSPKGNHILTLAEYNVRISVWSLSGRSVAFIDNPILKEREFSFSADGNYFAVIVGPLLKYRILIFSTFSWIVKQEIYCSHSINVPNNPIWSPINIHLVIWDFLDLKSANLEIYSLQDSKLVGTFKKSKGVCGITAVSWVTTGQFLLIGCVDECVYVLNYITWNILTVLEHFQVVDEIHCKIYEESYDESEVKVVCERPIILSKGKRSSLRGVTTIRCNEGGRFVAIQCRSMPAVVWVWTVGLFDLTSVLIRQSVVTDFKWQPDKSILFLCSQTSKVLMWRPRYTIYLESHPLHQHCVREVHLRAGKGEDCSFLVITIASTFLIGHLRLK